MSLKPEVPRTGEPIRAEFMRRLMEWIDQEIRPRGDGYTTEVANGTVRVISRPELSDFYRGMFRLSIESSEDGKEEYVMCRDGSGEKQGICGICELERYVLRYEVPESRIKLPPKSGVVVLMAMTRRGEFPPRETDFRIRFAGELPSEYRWPEEWEEKAPSDLEDVRFVLLGRVFYDPDSKRHTVVQEHFGMIRIPEMPTQIRGWFSVGFSNKNEIYINGGYVNCNGVFLKVPDGTLPLREGIVCIKTRHNAESGIWETPVYEYAEPDASHYPIAEIESLDFPVKRYQVMPPNLPVAGFLATAVCPVEEEWAKDHQP
jgi:hypothetical protein